jgi:phosphoserine aminotransferase
VVPGDTVLVGDFTSTLLSRPVDWSKYGLVYASGGKNLGPAGVCVVVIRKDLLLLPAHPLCPSVLNYNKMASSTPIPNIYNTPPTFLIYMMSSLRVLTCFQFAQLSNNFASADLVLEDCKKKGGVEGAQSRAIKRSSMLYEIIDKSGGFYMNNVEPEFRSRMNIPLRIRGGDKELEAKFVKEAEKEGLFQLYGHPLFGGLRITLYNGVPDDAVHKLAQFMKDFHASNSTEQ